MGTEHGKKEKKKRKGVEKGSSLLLIYSLIWFSKSQNYFKGIIMLTGFFHPMILESTSN
jgi:hypothetical protein